MLRTLCYDSMYPSSGVLGIFSFPTRKFLDVKGTQGVILGFFGGWVGYFGGRVVVDGSAKRGIWRLWRVCARCVMSLMVSLCFNWKVRRSWRASMPGMTVPVSVMAGFFLRFIFLWPRRNC